VNQWQGGLVRIVSGKGAGQIREVVSSTNNTLTIAGTWDTNQTPDNSSQFVVSKGSSETSVYATQSLSTGTNTATTLNDTTQRWQPDQWRERVVEIVAGPGTGQVRRITGNSASTLTVAGPDWSPVPDATSWYTIRRADKSTGSNTPTTLNDTTQDWLPNAWQGRTVQIVAGAGEGQSAVIQSNTTTQLTIQGSWATPPHETSRYVLRGAVPGVGQKWYDVDFKGQRRELRYDEQGRVQLKELYAVAAADPAEQTQYHYDTLGRLDVAKQQRWVPSRWDDVVWTEYQFDTENRAT